MINTNTIIKDLEEENKKLKNKIKVLQSKVKTYEADIEEVIVNAIEATAELLDEGFSEMRRDKPKQKHIKAFFKLFPTQANEQITQYLMAHTPKTYWDLFNAGTWVLSHGMNRKSWSTSHLESSLFKTVNTWAKA